MKRSLNRKSKRLKLSAEWIAFTLAALVMAVLIGLILLIWATQTNQPPVLSVRQTTEVRKEQGQFYVPFLLENQGGETVESVQVVGELQIGEIVETGNLNIDFLSGGEQAEGAFVFSRNPDQGRLQLRVAGYQLP